MFGFLPPPVDDELLYGLLARHAALLGKQRSATLTKRLLGGRFTADLPNLSHFGRAAPSPSWLDSPATLLRTMTAFPYYEHGMSADRAHEVETALLNSPEGVGEQGNFRRRAMATLRWCPDCAEQDRTQFGHGTWRVSHQLPEVYVCPVHGCAVLDSRIPMRAQAQLLVPPMAKAGYDAVPCRYSPEVATRLARSSVWLLRNVRADHWRPRIPTRLARAMAGRPWFVDGHFRKWPLAEAVLNRFGAGAFENTECLHLVKNVSTLRPELMRRGCINVSRLLLLLELCDLEARTFFEDDTPDKCADADWSTQRHAKGNMPFAERFKMGEALTLALPPAILAKLVTAETARRWMPNDVREHERWGSSEAKDRWWAEAVTRAAVQIRARPYPERVSRDSIQRSIGLTSEIRHLAKSPRTRAALVAALESREDYLLRKLSWLVTLLRNRGEDMTLYLFLKQVGRKLPAFVRAQAEEAHAALPPGGVRVPCRSARTLAAIVESAAAPRRPIKKPEPA